MSPLRLTLLVLVLLPACSRQTATAVDDPERGRTDSRPLPIERTLTADDVIQLIRADGAAHTLAVLSGPADPTGADKVLAGVATGQPDWLAVGQAFRPVAQGALAERLSLALHQALSRNAAGVLRVLKATSGPSKEICQEAPATTAAVAAVTAVAEPELQIVKQECLGYMSGPIEG